MMIKQNMRGTFLIGGLLALTFLLSACAGLQANPTGTTTAKRYTMQECKQMHGRGVINLEQKRQCNMGQPFEVENTL